MRLKDLHRPIVFLSVAGVVAAAAVYAETARVIILDQWNMEADARMACAPPVDKCHDENTKRAREFANTLRALFEATPSCAGVTFGAIVSAFNASPAVEGAMRKPHWVLLVSYRPDLHGYYKATWSLHPAGRKTRDPGEKGVLLPSLKGPTVISSPPGTPETPDTIVRRACSVVAGQGGKVLD